MSKRLTTEDFMEKAKLKHGDKYDYSLVDYKNRRTKVIKINTIILLLIIKTEEPKSKSYV
jgi:hypothetical protein